MSDVVAGYSRNRYRFRQVVYDEYRSFLPEYKLLSCYSAQFHQTGQVSIVCKYLGRTVCATEASYTGCVRHIVDSVFLRFEQSEGTARGPVMDVSPVVAHMRNAGKLERVGGYHEFNVYKPVPRLVAIGMDAVQEVLATHPAASKVHTYERSV